VIVAIFRARIREGYLEEYYALADKLAAIARSLPGFISWKGYIAEDGERVSVHEWESAEDLARWREHPVHKQAQTTGREKFYEEYTLYVCDQPRESRFKR